MRISRCGRSRGEGRNGNRSGHICALAHQPSYERRRILWIPPHFAKLFILTSDHLLDGSDRKIETNTKELLPGIVSGKSLVDRLLNGGWVSDLASECAHKWGRDTSVA